LHEGKAHRLFLTKALPPRVEGRFTDTTIPTERSYTLSALFLFANNRPPLLPALIYLSAIHATYYARNSLLAPEVFM
jgi:hypothetical protein